jgi:hypothetical protein
MEVDEVQVYGELRPVHAITADGGPHNIHIGAEPVLRRIEPAEVSAIEA